MEPCMMCAGAILQSRIKKIYYSIKGNDKVHAEAALENVINAFKKIVG